MFVRSLAVTVAANARNAHTDGESLADAALIDVGNAAGVALEARQTRRFGDANVVHVKTNLTRDIDEALGRWLLATPDAIVKLLRDLARRAGVPCVMMMCVMYERACV